MQLLAERKETARQRQGGREAETVRWWESDRKGALRQLKLNKA